MRDFFRKRIVTVIILIATVGLAGIAIFTAIRLYQLRQTTVAPNVPTSKPAAAAPIACRALTFTISAATPTPTPTETPSGTPTPTPSGTATPTPSATPTATPASTATPLAPTPTPAPQLPSSGTSLPTVIGIGAGILLLIVSAVLAL